MSDVPPLERRYVKNKISLLSAGIRAAEDEADRRSEVLSHVKSAENDDQFQLPGGVAEFPEGLTWFNSGPLTQAGDLRGKLVVLDFFTYCCVNCMHILPDLAELERAHIVEDGLVIIGVHSAKFLNEKVSENIANAVRRYEIHHPVVNDADIVLWTRLGVTCWPTLVILSPSGHLLHYIIGEGHGAELRVFVDTALEYYRETGQLSSAPLPERETKGEEGEGVEESERVLKYPGKLWCSTEGNLYVSDTGHHRVVELDMGTGAVRRVFGSGEPGLKDGEAGETQFHSPQGLVRNEDSLYVADTENHVIRKV